VCGWAHWSWTSQARRAAGLYCTAALNDFVCGWTHWSWTLIEGKQYDTLRTNI
jgi:hypothetical protein